MTADNTSDPFLLRPDDAAKKLAISPSKLSKMTRAGEIPVIRFNRCLRYDPLALRDWIASKLHCNQN